MQKDVILTPEGLDKLKQEIEYLSTTKRREVAERIKEAREFGDISENSEYDDAKNEQAMLEARIATLEDKLRSASVIDASELSADVVRVGSQVKVTDAGSGKELTYTIVGSTEADPSANRLSNESPVGQAIVGRKKGDAVKVTLPSGKQRELTVTKIEVAWAWRRASTPSSSPPAAASSRVCGRRGSTRSRTPTPTSRRSPTPKRRRRGSTPAGRRRPAPASPAACTPAAARARWPFSTSTTAAAGSSCR